MNDWTDKLRTEMRNEKQLTRKDGWPTHTGPLATLHRLGFIQNLEIRPKWLSWPKTLQENGAPLYTGTTRVMFKEGLQALTALTLEGYAVRVSPFGPTELEISITGGETS